MRIIKPPQEIVVAGKAVFLAGSIEMGTAENWQIKVEELLKDTGWTILNPRRDNWDPSWDQKKENEHFRGQVLWELEAQKRAEKIIMYFDPTTKSPISLLELGLFAASGRMIVICPDEFWRKGNVDIVCEEWNVKQVNTIEEAVALLA